MALTFEWDPSKALRNQAKHGVTFEEASTVFLDPLGGLLEDPRHSLAEHRLVLVGMTDRQRLVAVMFTEKDDRVRIISARHVTRAEHKTYEETPR